MDLSVFRKAPEGNLKAFLQVIRTGEGTLGYDGYRTLVGGEHFDSFDDHPRKFVTLRIGGKDVTSSAAGAYQILARTWDSLDSLGLPDFSPQSQDMAAVALIDRRGALEAVLAGRFEEAIRKCNREWASLPGSPYGQPTMTIQQARQVYEANGGRYEPDKPLAAAPAAPIEDRPLPPYTEPAPPQEPAMPAPLIPIVSALVPALLPALIEHIPALASIFGDRSKASKEQYAQAGVKVLEVIQAATGSRNAQEAVEKVASDPAAKQAAQEAVRTGWFELQEVAGGVAAAREANAAAPVGFFGLKFHEALTLILVAGAYTLGGLYLFTGSPAPEMAAALVTALVISSIGAVVAYWFGSTSGSAAKSELLARK